MTYLVPINLYKIFCETDDKWEYLFFETEITTCPTNNSHSIAFTGYSMLELNFEYNNNVTTKNVYKRPTIVDTTVNNINMILPNLINITDDKIIILYKKSTLNTCYIYGFNNQTINGSSSYTMDMEVNVIFKKESNTNWDIVDINTLYLIKNLCKKIELIDNVKKISNLINLNSTISTTSITYIVIPGITYTTVTYAKYLIILNLIMKNSTIGIGNFIIININGNDVTLTEKFGVAADSKNYETSINYITDFLDVGTIIKARWKSTGGTTATIYYRTLTVTEI